LAFALAVLGLATHIALAAYLIRFFLTGAPERRVVTPVWHLSFVGFILGPLVWIPLGHNVLAVSILAMTLPIAFAIWTASALQFMRRVPPAPLRPLLAIHLAPASLFAVVLSDLGLPEYAGGFAALAVAILLLLAVGLRWMTEAGFSAMWGAFTFPLAACTSAVLAQGWALPGAMLLVVASAAVLHIAIKVMKSWADGGLAAKSNAAVA
jgi:tellurite resistance protein